MNPDMAENSLVVLWCILVMYTGKTRDVFSFCGALICSVVMIGLIALPRAAIVEERVASLAIWFKMFHYSTE